MAETVVNLLLGKLKEEATFLSAVQGKAESVENDLRYIYAFLEDADKKRDKDNRVKCWVNDVKDVSHSIEDAFDEYSVAIAESNLIFGGEHETLNCLDWFREALKQIGMLPMKMIAKHNLGTKIDGILQKIEQIKKNRSNYDITGLGNSNTYVASSNSSVRPFMITDIDETDIVGFEVDKKTIIDQLTDANIAGRHVLSIVGAGGSGKTTLALKVFNSAEVKRHFAIRIWVTISQEYNLIDILIKILKQIKEVGPQMREKEKDELITELYKSLSERNYLVIFDDVWSTELWTDKELKQAFPSTIHNSRVLITTRFNNIANEADAESKPHQIPNLNEEESQQLLLKKIFPNQYKKECPEHLLPLATQFARKCDGLPLALIVLGGILSRKDANYSVWDEVMRNMDWRTDGRKCMGVLSTSYEHLPNHLKACFMYLAVFPEDYKIKASSLIQMWVAEGFISHDSSKQLEDIAESYLEELAQRCMVKVSSTSVKDKIKYCHLHDLLRELAINKAKEENFLMALCKNDVRLSARGPISARRLALNYCGDMPLANAATNLRSLHYFGDNMPNPSRFRMLRVLNISDYTEDTDGSCENYWEKWKTLTALRYYGFDEKGHSIASRYADNFLSSLYHLKNLQTVNILFTSTNAFDLPMSFWENKLLRHVIFRAGGEPLIDGPPLSADLPNLLTLQGVKPQEEWGAKLPRFPLLRKLKLFLWCCDNVEQIVNTLITLQDLDCLYIHTNKKAMPLLCGASAMRSYDRLSSLHLNSGSDFFLMTEPEININYVSMLLPHLVVLKISYFKHDEDPMPQLEKLSTLKFLKLISRNTNQSMICSRGGFPSLQQLNLQIGGLAEWKIEDGAMVSLNRLVLASICMKECPNLQFLTNLQWLNITCHYDLKLRLQGDDHWKIKRISSITFDPEFSDDDAA